MEKLVKVTEIFTEKGSYFQIYLSQESRVAALTFPLNRHPYWDLKEEGIE